MNVVLAGDIGGTNINLGIVELGRKTMVRYRERQPTAQTKDFAALVNTFLQSARKRGFHPTEGCFAVAGPLKQRRKRTYVKMTNAPLEIDEAALERATALKRVKVINDFQAIGYAIGKLSKKEVKVLRPGKGEPGGTKAVLGVGTGLGASILIHERGHYRPILSEAGHVDLPFFTEEELALAHFVRKDLGFPEGMPIEYEHVLSGAGIERLYRFVARGADKKAQEVIACRSTDAHSKEAIELFMRLLVRCCRNFVLSCYATGGLYIAGGVVANNSDLFDQAFAEELSQHKPEHDQAILRAVPVSILTNYDISVPGAALALARGES